VPRLLEVSLTSEMSQAYQATSVLEGIGSEAVPVLLAHAESSSHPRLWETVESVLLSMGEEARPALLHASDTSGPAVALLARRLLRSFDEEAQAEALAEQELTEVNSGVHATGVPVSAEDERILTWFKDVDLTQFLTPLQLFWCIGQVDRAAMESAGRALGYSRLHKRLKELQPTFTQKRLPKSIGYIRERCLEVVDGLFDKEPFYSNAWSDIERGLALRAEYLWGDRKESCWTQKSRKAWGYVDRFLSVNRLLPEMTVADR
jgi:hypothetical protein